MCPVIYECFHFWNRIPWSLHSFLWPDQRKERSKEGKPPPHHYGLRFARPPLTE